MNDDLSGGAGLMMNDDEPIGVRPRMFVHSRVDGRLRPSRLAPSW